MQFLPAGRATLLAFTTTPKGAPRVDPQAEPGLDRRHYRNDHDRRATAKPSSWTLERIVMLLTLGFSVAGFVFGIGVQWERTTTLEATVKARDESVQKSLEEIRSGYVPREVYTSDQKYLTASIERLTAALERRRLP